MDYADNFVRPWLIRKGSGPPFLPIFVGVGGGALTFGFIGVFLGPTLMSVAFRLIEEWSVAETPAAPDADPVGNLPPRVPCF